MLRKPGSLYIQKRSENLLKLKTFYDAEAVVIGHTRGRVRCTLALCNSAQIMARRATQRT
jgi:ATP-dependent DNA ligase